MQLECDGYKISSQLELYNSVGVGVKLIIQVRRFNMSFFRAFRHSCAVTSPIVKDS